VRTAGLDALNFANEGKLVIAVAREAAENVLAHLRLTLGRDAAIIGEVVERPACVRRAVRREADAGSSPRRAAAENLLTASGPGLRLTPYPGYKTARTCSPAKRSASREKPA
jgi:hypothetical protein